MQYLNYHRIEKQLQNIGLVILTNLIKFIETFAVPSTLLMLIISMEERCSLQVIITSFKERKDTRTLYRFFVKITRFQNYS